MATKAKTNKKPAGRPTDFTQALGDMICERIADGESLRSICLDATMPNKATVFRWLGNEEYSEFRDQYARARETQADSLVDEMLDIADDGTNDWMEKLDKEQQPIGWVENGEALRRSAMRLEARKWLAGKLRPKKYGDKIEVEGSMKHGVDDSVTALMSAINGKTRSL